MTQDIHIDGTSMDPATRAQETLAERADAILSDFAAHVALACDLRLSPDDSERTRSRLVEFCTTELVDYLDAVDRVLYAVAAGASDTRLLVRGLRAQQGIVAGHVADVRRANTLDELTAAARSALALCTGSREIERSALTPALAALPGVDLTELVRDLDTVLAGGSLDTPESLDVREIPHGKRHPRIFGNYARLAPGESFVLVNNHDPKPLRREFEATYPGIFTWDYVESGPERWQVRIGRRVGGE